MNVINVGFSSKYWSVLVEGSDEYKALSIALDDGNSKTATHIMNTVKSLLQGEHNEAYREAHLAIKSASGAETGAIDTISCPFCGGDGVVEFEHTPMNAGYQDPADAVDAEASCDACSGDGVINSVDLIDTYASESFPEHVVMSVIRGDMTQAISLAKEVYAEIESHASDNIDKSSESVGE